MPRSRPKPLLPAFIAPMLATLGPAFDSDKHVFEIKWDGFRSLAFNDAAGLRLVGRRKTDFTARFPELQVLNALPAGTVLDGEIVQIKGGRPDFSSLLKRERSWSGAAKPNTSRFPPVTFIAFDLLYEKHESAMHLPLTERLARLAAIIEPLSSIRIVLSDVHFGNGLQLFEQVNQQGLEGVIAKRADSVYDPGQRSTAWIKFKRRQSVVCAIVGYEVNTTRGIKSLLLAADVGGQLRFVGKVGTGITPSIQDELSANFTRLLSRQPIVPCTISQARWLQPGLFCRVSFAEWTNDYKLRQPVFEAIV